MVACSKQVVIAADYLAPNQRKRKVKVSPNLAIYLEVIAVHLCRIISQHKVHSQHLVEVYLAEKNLRGPLVVRFLVVLLNQRKTRRRKNLLKHPLDNQVVVIIFLGRL